MLRPTVVLPQPDSPTSARVSPGKIVRSTPSTAFTWPVTRLQDAGADRETRCAARAAPAGRSPVSTVMAAPPARRDGTRRPASPTRGVRAGSSLRQRSNTNGQRVWKRQPAGHCPGRGTAPLISSSRVPARLRPAGWIEQALRIGMPRPAQQLLARALLDDLARVHDGDAVGHLVHHAEVVGDEQHRGAGGGGEVADQLQDLRADGGVERGGGLVGRSAAAAAWPSPWRSSRAA